MRRLARWCGVALLATLGCGGTNPCKQGTLLVAVTFDSVSRTADDLQIAVAVGSAAPRPSTLPHTAGMGEGTIEIDFPGGYAAGAPVGVGVRALRQGVEVGTGFGTIILPDGCGSLDISVSGADGGGGAGGAAGTTGAGGSAAGTTGTAGTGGAAGTGGTAGTGMAGTGGAAGTGTAGTGGIAGVGGRGGTTGVAGTGGGGTTGVAGRGGTTGVAGSGSGGTTGAGGRGGTTGVAGTGGSGPGGGGRGGTTGVAGTGGGVVIPTLGLVGYWELNGTGADSSGNGNNATVTGTTATTDRFGAAGALSFTAANNEAVTVTNETPFDLPAFTITAFVRLAPSTATRVIVSKAPPTGFGNFTLQINADNSAAPTRLSWAHDTPMGNFSAGGSTAALPLNTYVHVAVTMDATALRFYVDGVLNMAHANPPAPGFNDAHVLIGRGTYNGFVGAIDSVRIYNRALTAAEIAAISADR